MTVDPFGGRIRPQTDAAPFDNCLTITPSDDDDLPVIPSAFIVVPYPKLISDIDGVTTYSETSPFHSLRMVMQNGEILELNHFGTLENQPILPYRPRRILATGTTAGEITLLW